MDDNKDRGDNTEATSDESGDTDDQELDTNLESEDGTKIESEEGDEEEGTTKVETKEPQIPKKRFDKAVGKARREAEAERARAEELAAKLKGMQGDIDASKVEEEIDTLEEDLEKAMADNNAEAKKRIRKEIREKTQMLADARANVKATYEAARAVEQIRYESVVETMEKEHPELNPDEDGYDEEIVAEITDLKEAFEAKGEASSIALKKAVKIFYKGVKEEAKEEAEEGEETEEQAAERKAAAVKKGLETKGKQPPKKPAAGLDSSKAGKKEKVVDVSKLSDSEFKKLSKEDKARARGDAL